ncbi:MAG: UvrD-helicase domain-containing protein [Bacteroidales bacterium]|nr:UvrD-helicase domain-containing protein [Bacteroidales bacterium]
MRDIFLDLNDEQRVSVEALDGPVMVVAGAGSGKTRVLTYKVAHLLNSGVDPFRVLALTFTNKAAREMKERIIHLVGNADARNVWMGTFHSVFARILRVEGHLLGYSPNFTIYDNEDSKRLIKGIVREQNLDDKVYAAGYVLYRISSAKTNLITAQRYNSDDDILLQDKLAGKPQLGNIYNLYHQKCFRASAMDFDDLLLNTYILLRDFPDVLLKYQRKFEYILVDEYQDTNQVQYSILKKLAANNENICVVGDDAQSIYAFRGANIKNILNFQKDYPDVKVFKLEQNYRSTKTIVNAANSIIVNNKDQIFKKIWTQNEDGSAIDVLAAKTDTEEGQMIANSIFETKMNFQVRNIEFAILYRTNAQSRSLEEALRKLNIPYRIYGGTSFYNRKEVKDVLAYFRLCVNNKDEEALQRVINLPARGIGKTTLEKITVEAEASKKAIWEIISNSEDLAGLRLGSSVISRITDFVTMIKSFSAQLFKKNAYELGKHISASSGILKALYEDNSYEGIARYENVEELINALSDFAGRPRDTVMESGNGSPLPDFRTLNEFMQEVALLTDADKEDKSNNDRVSLMTVHAAKGLEFPYVYVAGLEENLFPSIQSLNSRSDLEEERRLFYVAITRAQKKLHLSYAESRFRWGNHTFCEPSRFIDEVDARYLSFPGSRKRKGGPAHAVDNEQGLPEAFIEKAIRNKNLKKINALPENETKGKEASYSDETEVRAGDEVMHDRFGKGKVLNVEGAGSNRKATVFFQAVGKKQLLLKFARLKVL